MAPTLFADLAKRYYCNDEFDNCNYNSGWDNWGRWVALAVIIVVFIILALGFSCMNNRRRRRRGAPPMYGTAWMPAPAYKPYEQGQSGQYYANQPYHGGNAAPPYSPQVENNATGNTFNSNDGYYGHGQQYGHQSGIELQQPTGAYVPQRGGDDVYAAPTGPPPSKGEYVVR